MCAFLGPGLKTRRGDLALVPFAHQESTEMRVAAASTAVVSPSAGPPRAAAAALAIAPPKSRTRAELAKRLEDADLPTNVTLRQGLAAARGVLAVRRLVPAGEMPTPQVYLWLDRLANARRISALRLELVGIFPRLPLGEGATIRLDSQRDEAHFQILDGPRVLTTIAVARRRDTGESVVARLV
ncbi:MAG: hypothetical protein VKP62_10605 [Candidatus Sericytochromatia bacterium]|nr:hypothetical protein [Candidatus Sericytochromatia bacterium]